MSNKSSHLSNLFFVLFTVFPSFFISGVALSAETLETLKLRRESIEDELQRINVKIAQLEKNATVENKSIPSHYIEEFGFDMNSAGGVEPWIAFKNPLQSSSIKYINVTIKPYNAVGDVAPSSIGQKTTAHLEFTGPLSHDEKVKTGSWAPVWYNSTIECLRIESVKILFMNGKSASFSGKELSKALAPNLKNSCRVK